MSFVLVDFIYRNLEFLTDLGILNPLENCGPSAQNYLDLRAGIGYEVLETLDKLSDSPVGDEKFRAEVILQNLVHDVRFRQEDGLYWVLISDSSSGPPSEEVIGHVFVIEKVKNKFCLIQTYVGIGNRSICGIPVCRVERENIVERLQNITDLLTSDEDTIYWNEREWNSWLQNLGVPPSPPRNQLVIRHRRALWGFVPLTDRGVLFRLFHAIRQKIPRWVSQYQPIVPRTRDEQLIQTDYERYSALLSLLSEIEQISAGTDYLDNNEQEIKHFLREFRTKLNRSFFRQL